MSASTLSANHIAELLAQANGDWAVVIAQLTGQAISAPGSAAAGGSASGTALGTEAGAGVDINSISQAQSSEPEGAARR